MACTLGIEQPCSECRMCGNPPGNMEGKPPKRTNADRIRNMTNEELAEFLERFGLGDIDYTVTFCDLCRKGGNALNLDCSGCLRYWLERGCDE